MDETGHRGCPASRGLSSVITRTCSTASTSTWKNMTVRKGTKEHIVRFERTMTRYHEYRRELLGDTDFTLSLKLSP